MFMFLSKRDIIAISKTNNQDYNRSLLILLLILALVLALIDFSIIL